MSKSRALIFEGRPTRAQVVDAATAALDDEGLQLREGSWGRITIVIDGDGRFIANIPFDIITPKEA